VTAEKGYTTLLKDKDDTGIARGTAYIQENWGKKVKRKRMTVSSSMKNNFMMNAKILF